MLHAELVSAKSPSRLSVAAKSKPKSARKSVPPSAALFAEAAEYLAGRPRPCLPNIAALPTVLPKADAALRAEVAARGLFEFLYFFDRPHAARESLCYRINSLRRWQRPRGSFATSPARMAIFAETRAIFEELVRDRLRLCRVLDAARGCALPAWLTDAPKPTFLGGMQRGLANHDSLVAKLSGARVAIGQGE